MNNLEIKEIRKKLGLTQTDFGKMLGVGLRSVQNWESGARNISESAKILLKQKLENEHSSHNNTHKPEGKIINENDYPVKEVYIVPIKGRGGLENVYYADEAFGKLETELLQVKQMPSNGSKYFKIEVEGISMDDGSKRSLAEGDWAYCRSIGKQYWKSKLHSHKWDIFCFFHNERGIIFKKIKDQNTETGELLLESLHPDKEQFPDFTIKVSECSYICNVIKVLSEF